jgi:hypothetical protein
MDEQQQAALLQFFKAAGQPERIKILGLLAGRPYTIAELAAEVGLKEMDTANQVHKLVQAGLVREDSRSLNHTYQLDNSGLAEFNYVILGIGEPVDPAAETMSQFVEGQSLRRIPQDPAQRRIILQWLAEEFEVNRAYTEAEVDAIIGRHYPSQVMLRRYLVDGRLLKRVGGLYWRVEVS